jgi:ankyrin repeat protein
LVGLVLSFYKTITDYPGQTPLHKVAIYKSADAVAIAKILLEAGASKDVSDGQGITAAGFAHKLMNRELFEACT